LEEAIQNFLTERKAARVKSKLKSGMTDEEKQEATEKAEEEFLLENWLPNAANRAKQLSLVSHPGKFSHPSAKISSIIASEKRRADGFLRTGNVNGGEVDVLGNAASLDVFKFLSLRLSDEQTILFHLEQGSKLIQQQFKIKTASFSEIQSGFLEIQKNEGKPQTSARVKQVYFPVHDDYHLLSILTPSGLLFELKKRINAMRFSDQAKEGRESRKKSIHSENGFDDLLNLTVIGYGGTKPQNISVLNSQNGGNAYLLLSVPPALLDRNVKLPKQDFFKNNLWPNQYKESFKKFHNLLQTDYNNSNIRTGLDNKVENIIGHVIEEMWKVRQYDKGWSHKEVHSKLPLYQKIWLDDAYIKDRENSDEWLSKVIKAFTNWFTLSYKKVLGKKAETLGDIWLAHIQKCIETYKEDLR